MTASRVGAGLRFVGWMAGLMASVAVLARLGDGPLGTPPFRGGRDGLVQWMASRDPATLLMSGIRVLALATAVYLLAATLFAVVAQTSKAAPLISLSERITVPMVRRLVGGTIGIAVTMGPWIASDPGWAASPGPTPPGAAAAYSAGPAVSVVEPPPALAPLDPPVLTRLPDDAGPAAPAPAQPPISALRPDPAPPPTAAASAPKSPPPAPAPSPPASAAPSPSRGTSAPMAAPSPAVIAPSVRPSPEPAPAPATATWTVQPGEHLWLIAAKTLEAARRRPVSDDEVAPYWESVVRTNRAGLPDPANADLLYAGMHIVLPPVP